MSLPLHVFLAAVGVLAAATGDGDGTCEAGEDCPSVRLLQMGLKVRMAQNISEPEANWSLEPAAVSAAAASPPSASSDPSQEGGTLLKPTSVTSGVKAPGVPLHTHFGSDRSLAPKPTSLNNSAVPAGTASVDGWSKLGYFRQVLHNEQDLQYSGKIELGGQTLMAVLDTGSFELLVFGAHCFTCGLAAKYDFKLSPTYKSGYLMTTHSFGSGTCQSVDGTDRLKLGNGTFGKQDFWEVLRSEMPVLATARFQAILGLAPPGEPQMQAMRLMEGGPQEKFIAKTIFAKNDSVLMNFHVRYFSACFELQSRRPGYLVWNDVPPKDRLVPFTELVVTDDIHWYTQISSVRLSSRKGNDTFHVGCSDGCQVLFDTGTSLIAVPSDAFDLILHELNELDQDCRNLDQMPNLVFELGNHTYSLPATSYIGIIEGYIPEHVNDFFRPPKKTAIGCRLLLMTAPPGEDLWILGMPFFRYYYTTFDLGDNPYKMEGRRIWTAPADPSCQPTDGRKPEEVTALSWAPWRVNATMIRPPPKGRRSHGGRHPIKPNPTTKSKDYHLDKNTSRRRDRLSQNL